MIVHNKLYSTQRRWQNATLPCLLIAMLLGGPSPSHAASGEPELFRPSSDPQILSDDPGIDGKTGYADGFMFTVIQGYAIAEGDMVLGRVDGKGRLRPELKYRGLGRNKVLDRWTDGVVPFQFGENLSANQMEKIRAAVAHWNERTTISMIERTADNAGSYNDYIVFITGNSCSSWVGKTGGEQEVWVAESCTEGSIIHEIGHAIGLFHEHTRPDRNSFISVQHDNIKDSFRFNFDITAAGASPYGDYDYGSIMHYGEKFFSANGERTIISLQNKSIGQRVALSNIDAASVDLMYATDLALDATTSSLSGNVEIDVAISNAGTLGAHDLSLTVSIGPDADWLSISTDSGWDCKAFGEELRCTRGTLPEGAVSRFTLEVDPVSGSLDNLSMKLVSESVDLDPLNNVINAAPEPAFVMPSADAADNSTSQPGSNQEPNGQTSDAQPIATAEPQTAAASPAADASGGGTTGHVVLLGLLLAARRRRDRAARH